MARNWLDDFMTAAARRKDRRGARDHESKPAVRHPHEGSDHAAPRDPGGYMAHAAHGTGDADRLALAPHQTGGTTRQAASADAADGSAFAAPRRADSVAQAANAAGTYNYTGYAQFVTVSQTGMFDIKAYGGQGGNGNYSGGFNGPPEGYGAGGKGAEVGGDVELTKGEKLKIVVGGDGGYGYNGGGGGGTFVEVVDGNGTYTPLLIAGGGGGGSVAQAGGAGSADQTGKGASGAFYGNAGGGGAGIHGSAQPAPTKYSGGSGYNEGGNYAGGLAGLNQLGGRSQARGGFGGGGGGANYGARRYSGGGGGGYSGGKGGGYTGAQGGTSFVASGFSNVVRNSGVQSGKGLVTIAPGAVSPTTPANTFIYDTAAGSGLSTTTEPADSQFAFSFTTTSASTLNMWSIAVANIGNSSGSYFVSINSNSNSNTPGTALAGLALQPDNKVGSGITTISGSGATVPSLNGIADGPPFQFQAHTTYWLTFSNLDDSYLQPVQDNSAPGIGFANEYTYDSAASTSHSYDNGRNPLDGAIQVTLCFAAGTAIRTTRGDIAIEALHVGDLMITAAGEARPIRWIGKRTLTCASHRESAMVQPIRIAAGAFGGGRPYRDLLLSPHHAVAVTCVGEVLVPIRLLANGTTIAQLAAVSEVTYWHVELDSHDVILANGLPAESYIDVGNRCDFEGEASLTLHPEFRSHPAIESEALAGYCRPFVTGGAVLAAIRAQLAEVAGNDASALPEPGFQLLVDGKRIAPIVRDHHAAFVVPAGAGDLRLVSPSFAPRDLDSASRDDRRLGLMIEAIVIDDLLGTVTEVPLDDPALVSGFHPLESGPAGTWRWTNGDALLSAALLPSAAGPCVLRLTGRFAAPDPKQAAENAA